MDEFIKISQKIGKNSIYVQGAGGNTSVKIDNTLYIKSSGEQLKDMSAHQGYVSCDYLPLALFVHAHKNYTKKIEAQFLRLLDAQILPESSYGKPSMETGFHAIIPSLYIFHLHSVYINIFLCMRNGEKVLQKILEEDEFLFVNYTNPGYALAARLAKYPAYPMIIFLQNHGVIIHGNDIHSCVDALERIHKKIEAYLQSHIPFTPFRIRKKVYTEKQYLFPDAVVFMSMGKKTISAQKRKDMDAIFSAQYYIVDTIKKLGETPVFLSETAISQVLSMQQEKYRQALITKKS